MRTSFSVNDMTIHRIVEQGERLHADARLPADLVERNPRREPRLAGAGGYTARAGMSCCASSRMSSRRRITTSWSIAASATTRTSRCGRPGTRRTTPTDEGAEGCRPRGRGHRFRDVHASARRSRRLEHAPGEWPLGPDLSEGALPVSKKNTTYWSEIHRKTPLDQITDSVLPIIEANRAELSAAIMRSTTISD